MGSGSKPKASNPRKHSSRKARGQHPDSSPSQRRLYRLRCPFHAKFPDNPRYHNSSCQGSGFETNARVVEHLKRAHGPVDFDAVAELGAGIPGIPQATARDSVPERVTDQQLLSIANLPRTPDAQQKWDMIYRIIFPDDEAVKPAYIPSMEWLRDHARNPPDWLISNLIAGGMGGSREEILSMMQNFLLFFDIIRGGPSALPQSMPSHPTMELGQSSNDSESLGDDYMDEIKDIDLSFDAEYTYSFDIGDSGEFDFDNFPTGK